MAINPVNFIVSPSATATNGSDTITVTGSVDCSRVFAGTAVFIGTRHVVEALSGTAPNGSGNSTIKLKENWTDPTTTAVLTAMYTPEGLATAINYARDIVANISPIDDLVGTGLIEKTGVGTYSLLQKATTAQAQAGTDNTKYATSRTVSLYVNQYGLGNITPETIADFNDAGSLGGGIYRTVGTSLNAPLSVTQGNLLNMRRSVGDIDEIDGAQLLLGQTSTGKKVAAFRTAFDVLASTVPFLEMYHTENLIFAQNLSGSTISSNATTAGSNLSPAQSGTWRNVSGNDILNNGYGLFKRD